MSSSRPASPSPNPVGLWFCQISSGLQARRQSGGASDPQGARNGARGADTRQATTAPEPDAAGGTKEVVPVPVPPRRTAAPTTCRREAMPEATVYLLLDRFAPS